MIASSRGSMHEFPAGMQCPACSAALADGAVAAGQCPACHQPIALLGGRIPDFIGDAAVDADTIFAWPDALVDRLPDALLALYEHRPVQGEQADDLVRSGTAMPGLELTPLGREIAYHVAERARQANEAPFGGHGSDAALDPHAAVLDVGCGAGQSLRRLVTLGVTDLVGVDVNAEALAFGARLAASAGDPVRFVRASAHALPFVPGRFTHVMCRVGLNYMHQRRAAREMARVLRPSGFLHLRVEGPGFDLGLVARSGSMRERASRAFDLALGIAHALTGAQPVPGQRLHGGRAFASTGRLARHLADAGCDVVEVRVLSRAAMAIPEGIDVLARRTAQTAHPEGAEGART